MVFLYVGRNESCLGDCKIPYNPYLAHSALSKLEFPIGHIYCITPKERTPQPLQLSTIIMTISCKVGWEQKSLLFVVIWKQMAPKFCQNSNISLVHS